MNRARIVKRILLGLLLVLVLAGTGFVAFAYYGFYRPAMAFDASVARTRKAIAGHEREFLGDQAYAAGLPLFAPRKGARDAGPLIGPRVHWVRVKRGAVDYTGPSDAAIDRGLFDKLGEDWLDAPPELWRGLDFGWMAQLARSDFWDLEQNSVSDPSDPMGPDPIASDLFAWGKLRLAKGIHDDAVPAAVAEVEDLARLCFTTERWSVARYGIALLSDARRAREKAGLPPLEADLGRIDRALEGAHAFARLETPPEYESSYDQLTIGRCAALQFGAWSALVIRPQLRESRTREYRRLEDLLARTPGCRLGWIRQRWALPDDLSDPNGVSASWWEHVLWRWSPAYRRIMGETLVAIGAQDWFRGYDRERAR